MRFEVDSESLLSASYCHCTRCQRRTGTAASAQTQVKPGSVRITAGEDLISAWEADGGFGKLYCSLCGSALFSARAGERDPYSIRLGAFDADPGIRPQWRQFVAYAAPWEPIPDDGLPRHAERPPS